MPECSRKKSFLLGSIKSSIPFYKLQHLIRERRSPQHLSPQLVEHGVKPALLCAATTLSAAQFLQLWFFF